MTLLLFWAAPVFQINPLTLGFTAVLSVAVVPFTYSSWVTLPCDPVRIGLPPPVNTFDDTSLKFARSMLNPNGFVCTVLLLMRSFQIAGESQPSPTLSD